MTNNLVRMILSASAFFLLSGAPVAAEDSGTQPAPDAAAPSAAEPQAADDMGPGCAADGKCCGSSACAEAKRKSIEEGKAAVADCPCRKNRAMPKRDGQ